MTTQELRMLYKQETGLKILYPKKLLELDFRDELENFEFELLDIQNYMDWLEETLLKYIDK